MSGDSEVDEGGSNWIGGPFSSSYSSFYSFLLGLMERGQRRRGDEMRIRFPSSSLFLILRVGGEGRRGQKEGVMICQILFLHRSSRMVTEEKRDHDRDFESYSIFFSVKRNWGNMIEERKARDNAAVDCWFVATAPAE